jgi:nicotinic acetylcholine receptor
LTFAPDAADTFVDFYSENNEEWDVLSANVVQRNMQFSESATKSFPEIHFGVKVKRKPLFYIINVILVSVLLAFLVLLMLRLPAESGERISMGVTLLLAFSVFIMMVDASVPNSSIDVPLIIVYLLLIMTMTTLAIAESVLILHCYHHTGSNPPPSWARHVVFNFMAKCLCKRDQIRRLHPESQSQINGAEKMGTGEQIKKEPLQIISIPDDNVQEWREMSLLIDQFCFWLFLIVFALIMLILLVIVPYSQTGLNINDTVSWAGF